VRAEAQVDLTLLHRNTETGKTRTEQDHYAAHAGFVDGQGALGSGEPDCRNERALQNSR
jgi:hypothetical protein